MGCRRVASQGALVRVVRLADGSLALGRHLPGRGAWLCAGSTDCVDLAGRRRAFERALRGPVAPEAAISLRAEVERCARMDGRSTACTEDETHM
ncbi:MAG TPA: YlxR family protein [Acidimicrobiales bacterium]|nr:YlxR family protein [Acidimicrobiales bacterium]